MMNEKGDVETDAGDPRSTVAFCFFPSPAACFRNGNMQFPDCDGRHGASSQPLPADVFPDKEVSFRESECLRIRQNQATKLPISGEHADQPSLRQIPVLYRFQTTDGTFFSEQKLVCSSKQKCFFVAVVLLCFFEK